MTSPRSHAASVLAENAGSKHPRAQATLSDPIPVSTTAGQQRIRTRWPRQRSALCIAGAVVLCALLGGAGAVLWVLLIRWSCAL